MKLQFLVSEVEHCQYDDEDVEGGEFSSKSCVALRPLPFW